MLSIVVVSAAGSPAPATTVAVARGHRRPVDQGRMRGEGDHHMSMMLEIFPPNPGSGPRMVMGRRWAGEGVAGGGAEEGVALVLEGGLSGHEGLGLVPHLPPLPVPRRGHHVHLPALRQELRGGGEGSGQRATRVRGGGHSPPLHTIWSNRASRLNATFNVSIIKPIDRAVGLK